jgi:hypothetical protein
MPSELSPLESKAVAWYYDKIKASLSLYHLFAHPAETVVVSSQFSDAIKGFITISNCNLKGELTLKHTVGLQETHLKQPINVDLPTVLIIDKVKSSKELLRQTI